MFFHDTMNRHQRVIALAALFWALELAGSPAEAAGAWVEGAGVIKDGKVIEMGPQGTEVGIVWTGIRENQRVDLQPIPPKKTIGASGQVEFPVPSDRTAKDVGGTGRVVTDARQFTKLPNPGEVAVLEIAAFVPSGGDFLMFPLATYVGDNLGFGVALLIPDLFADTDGNGRLGIGDTLYSTVNLTEFLPASVNFNFGDTYSILNGTSPLLPGMLFGTQPIVPNASSPTGYDNPAPWEGEGVVLTKHGVVAVPEPDRFFQLLGGFILILIGFAARRRKQKAA